MKGFFADSTITKPAPVGMVPKCGACGLYKLCQSPKMPPYGRGAKKVLVVGEAPGETEDERNRPFIGKAGGLLRTRLHELGINLDKHAVTTNALICHPPHNETPDSKQIDYCRPNLINTIREVEPNVIVTLGRSALESVLRLHWKGKLKSLEQWIGWRIPTKDYWVCPTWHPSYLMRINSQMTDRMFVNHLERAFAITEPPPPQEEFQIDQIYDDREVYRILRGMDEEGGWIAFDYETNCLKPEYPEARIYSCAVSNGRRTIAYPWTGKAVIATKMLLKSKRTRKIASNAKFEERWTLKEFGHGVTNWGWDTMIAAHCLDNRPGICSIKFQAFIWLGITYNSHIEPYLENSRGGHYNRIQHIALKDLLQYNGIDSVLEYRVAMKQRKELKNND